MGLLNTPPVLKRLCPDLRAGYVIKQNNLRMKYLDYFYMGRLVSGDSRHGRITNLL